MALAGIALAWGGPELGAQDLASVAKTFAPRLETNLVRNIIPFWYPNTVDSAQGGYILNHDINGQSRGPGVKMIVTQARQLWLFARLAQAGYGGQEYLDAADAGFRFLRDKMWDAQNGGFNWEVDATGNKVLQGRKHLYGEAFALYALSEYYLASGKKDALDLATRLYQVLEEKAYDKKFGGYREWFNEDWTPAAPGEPSYVDGVGSEFKLMNTHLHLLEAMTAFYRASKLAQSRERLLELIAIQSNAVIRKGLGVGTDKFLLDWQPILTNGFAKVSYGHDLENIWLLIDACDAAGVSTYPYLDLYRALFDYSLKYGFDERAGGFFTSGPFNQPANNLTKTWWVQAEALVSSLYLYRLTHDAKYLHVFEMTYDWVDQHQVDWLHGEWFENILPDGTPQGDKAQPWKGGYHNGRAMIECLAILKSAPENK
jgi:cellobiose epimerase